VATIRWRKQGKTYEEWIEGASAQLNWSEGGHQQRKSLGGISPRDAEIARRQKEVEVKSGHRFSPSILFRDLRAKYVKWHRHEYPDSHQRIAQIVEQHLAPTFDLRPIGAITVDEIDEWKHGRLDAGAAPETVTKELRTLSAMLHRAVKPWKLIHENPCDEVNEPPNHDSEPVRWYTKDELRALYKGSPNHSDIWRLMVNTGIRRREAMQLRWSDVLPDRIRVVSRAGARTKSAKWREVRLSQDAMEALQRLRIGADGSGYVLPKVHRASLSRAFAKCLRRAKLDGHLHCLRHTFGAHLVSNGVPLRTVQVLMGHASFATTEKHYAHLCPDHLAGAIDRLGL
jgi:integrase